MNDPFSNARATRVAHLGKAVVGRGFRGALRIHRAGYDERLFRWCKYCTMERAAVQAFSDAGLLSLSRAEAPKGIIPRPRVRNRPAIRIA
jgi:hypothetical protein